MRLNSRKLSHYFIFAGALVISIYFLYLVREVLLTFFLGALLAYLLFHPVAFIEKKGLQRIWSIIALYLTAAVLSGIIVALVIPGLVEELSKLAGLYPQYAQEVQEMAGRLNEINAPEQLSQVINKNLGKMESYIYQAFNSFLGGFYNFLGKILALIFSPILAFYIMNDWEKIRDAFLNLFSPRIRHEITVVSLQIDKVLIEFIKGNLLVAALVGLGIGVSAALIGVKFPLLIGLLSGITNLVPYFGPILGGIPAVALAASESLRLALYMTAAIVIIQQLESNLITPKIIGGKLGLHPLVIVFALLAGGKLLGFWGMLFAVPVAAILKIIIAWGYLKLVE